MVLAELTEVRLTRRVETGGSIMPQGSRGCIVGVYQDGAAYEVEFFAPEHAVLTIEAGDVEAFSAAYSCSFCGKGQDEVAHLVAGPDVYICGEYVDLCNIIIDGRRSPGAA